MNWLHSARQNYHVWLKKRKIFKSNPYLKNIVLSKNNITNYYLNWAQFKKPSTDWLKMYIGISQNEDYDYIPETYYYTIIEPRLNNKIYTLPFADKNLYEVIHKNYSQYFPKVFLRKINGCIYSDDYVILKNSDADFTLNNITDKEVVVKPSSETGGGRNVHILKKKESAWFFKEQVFNLTQINKNYPNNFIIQEKINQHNFFANFNLTSVNTVRMFVYRSVLNNSINILHSVLRVGKKGQEVDNQASGGYSIGINSDGKLNSFAINKLGEKFTEVNGNTLMDGILIPNYTEMKKIAKEIAPNFFYNRLIAFDFCLNNQNQIKVLEVNLQNIEINFLQMNNGPLFGNFTKEIIDYCKTASKSVNFDFYV